MPERIIENEHLKVTVADSGAELVGVYDKNRAMERIWSGDPSVWNRHAPILFPFVGKVMGGEYRIGDRVYAMPTQHGFARDMAFECVSVDAVSTTHRLEATEWTRERYPYDFRLTVAHRLEGRRLTVAWTVENRGREVMYFSIGGHPGFMPPKGVRKEDCDILFPGKRALSYISASPAGYATAERKALALSNGRAPYRADIPDTWIFENGQVARVGIAASGGPPWVMLDCTGFPMLAVWANPRGPFICLEPWFGRTDDVGFSGTIDRKAGMQSLAAGAGREIAYSMEFC